MIKIKFTLPKFASVDGGHQEVEAEAEVGAEAEAVGKKSQEVEAEANSDPCCITGKQKRRQLKGTASASRAK